MAKKNIDLIRQALGAAESSIKLAKQLLNDLERGSDTTVKERGSELPGILGVFDGENMVAEDGKIFPVPANYASKSMLVVGDTLKLVEEGKEKRFKQIEHVKRYKTLGVLTKKDGKWKVITPEGSYKVLPAAVSHFGADVGSEVVLHLPSNNLSVPYGAIESVKQGVGSQVTESAATEVTKVQKTESESQVVEKEVERKEKQPKKDQAVGKVPKPSEKKPETIQAKEEVKAQQPRVVEQPKEAVTESKESKTVKEEPKAEVIQAPAVNQTADLGEEELR